MTPLTRRLYLEDARRKTSLATVTAHVAGGFLLDKTVFHAPEPRYHHPQPCDKGHVLVEGHKLKIERVGFDQRGNMVHRVGGPLPAPGASAQLHLDAPRRELQARAHTLMHLALAALADVRASPEGRAEVVGGGEVKFAARFRGDPKEGVAKLVARIEQLASTREPVVAEWMPREDALKRATPQGIPSQIAPDEPTLRVVRIGDSLLPCDAPLVEHVWQIGEWRALPAQHARGPAKLRLKVVG